MDRNDEVKVKESILRSLQRIVQADEPVPFNEIHAHALKRGELGLQKEYLTGLTGHLIRKGWVNEVESGLYICSDPGALKAIIRNNRRTSLRRLMDSINNGSKKGEGITAPAKAALTNLDPGQKGRVVAVVTALKRLNLGKGLTRMEMFEGSDLPNGWQHDTVKGLLAANMMLKTGERRERRYWKTDSSLDVGGIVRVLWPKTVFKESPAADVKLEIENMADPDPPSPTEAEVTEPKADQTLQEELQEALEQFMEIAEYQASRIEKLEGKVGALMTAFEAFATELGSPDIARDLRIKLGKDI